MSHIIAAWIFFVILLAIAVIIAICKKQTLLTEDLDFFSLLILRKKQKIENSNVNMTINTYLAIMIVTPLVLGVISFFCSKNATFSVIVALSSLLLPEGIIFIMQMKANKEFEERYVRSLDQLASSLKSGMSIMQAVQDVASNKFVHESIRKRYQNIYSDLQMGVPVADAFRHFAEFTNNKDARDVAVAIDVQNEIGGHEADVIMSIAQEIHNRIILRKEIKSIFSGTSSMIIIMDFIPTSIILFLCLTDASYLRFYFSSPIYIAIFFVLIGCCAFGSFINHYKLKKIMKGV